MFKKSTVSFCLTMLLSAPLVNACVVDIPISVLPDIYSMAENVILADGDSMYDLKSCIKLNENDVRRFDFNKFLRYQANINMSYLSDEGRYVVEIGEDSGRYDVSIKNNIDYPVLKELAGILSLKKPWTSDFERRYRAIVNAYEYDHIMPNVDLNASGKKMLLT